MLNLNSKIKLMLKLFCEINKVNISTIYQFNLYFCKSFLLKNTNL